VTGLLIAEMVAVALNLGAFAFLLWRVRKTNELSAELRRKIAAPPSLMLINVNRAITLYSHPAVTRAEVADALNFACLSG
jgi:hypothetical protein